MSDYHCKVVRLTNVQKHPNADTLSMGEAGGYPVIFQTATGRKEGDLVAYVPVDSVVPDTEEWSWLGGHRRIRAKRLRGIFSMGMIVDVPPGLNEGDDCMEALGIVKYEPVMKAELHMQTDNESDPGFLPEYTDIEGYRRHKHVLRPTTTHTVSGRGGEDMTVTEIPGEEVVLTEKVHGCNARYLYRDGRLWVGSHHKIKAYAAQNVWWSVADRLGLEARLQRFPGIAIYGEVFGPVQDLKYGRSEPELVVFDAYDTFEGRYLDYDDFLAVAAHLDLPTAPELYRGPWSTDLLALANGPTVIGGGKHTREGFVVRPVKERREHMGRVILKVVGEDYLLRKTA
jgi:RNA ligase (TIGR02306 family)